MELDEKILSKLLREAEKAHGEYEKKLGNRDENWKQWYAAYIIKQLKREDI
jgi:hypothetical protein